MVSFNRRNEKEVADNFEKYIDTANSTIVSSTGQLKWHYGSKGHFTINTPGTQGLVGFAKNKAIDMNDVQLKTTNDFATIFLSSLDKDKTIKNSKRVLITCMARARNTGMKFNSDTTELLEVGSAPILMEPVDATIWLGNNRKGTVHVLDHSGFRTGQTIPMKNGKIHLDGRNTQAIYYEVVF